MAVVSANKIFKGAAGSDLKDPLLTGTEEVLVIGAGYGRTGTTSLKDAFEKLYGSKCFHMKEVIENGKFNEWLAITSSDDFEQRKTLLHEQLKGYTCTIDFPSSVYFQEQMSLYPNAKVVLSVRAAEGWYKSAYDTIFGPISPGEAWYVWILPPLRKFKKMCGLYKKHMCKVVGLEVKPIEDKEFWIKSFDAWNEFVKKTVPPEKLLVYDVKQGWEPLCRFLGKAIPDEEFPHLNDAEALKGEFKKIRMVCLIVHAVLACIVAVVCYYLSRALL